MSTSYSELCVAWNEQYASHRASAREAAPRSGGPPAMRMHAATPALTAHTTRNKCNERIAGRAQIMRMSTCITSVP
eukprot:6185630-Pleurochrysis_carterae.AAC.2